MPQLFLDDCRNIGNLIEPNTIQTVITSPPYYGLRDYKLDNTVWGGDKLCSHEFKERALYETYCDKCNAWQGSLGLEPTPDMYCKNIVSIFDNIRKVMTKTGTVFLNIGDCYLSGSPAGSSRDACKVAKDEDEWAKLKHADPKNRARRFGVRPIDRPIPGLKQKDLIGIPWRVALAMQADGWYLRDAIIWAKAIVDEFGNLTGSAMPGPQKDRCTPAYEYIFQFTKSKKYYFNLDEAKTTSGATFRNVWSIPTSRSNQKHFASYPIGLVERCIKLGTQENDIVLDPFTGSGTTAIGCINLNRKFVGIEMSKEYFDIATNRINEAVANK